MWVSELERTPKLTGLDLPLQRVYTVLSIHLSEEPSVNVMELCMIASRTDRHPDLVTP